MKLSKKSIPYRLAHFWSGESWEGVPMNICPFMRHVIYGSTKLLLLTIAALTAIALADFALVSIVWTLAYWIFDSFEIVDFLHTTFYKAGAMLFLILLAAVASGAFVFARHLYSTRPRKRTKDKNPSVFVEYVKAKYDKICIPLEFE